MLRDQYKNINNLPDGTYRNIDTKFPELWIMPVGSVLHTATSIKQLKGEKILNDIYFSASAFPHKNRLSYLNGSVFEGWFVPSSAYTFTVTGDIITVGIVSRTKSYEEYQVELYDRISANIVEAYSKKPSAVLFLSGGIDSLVLLSFIMKLGYLDRTRVIFFKNTTQEFATYKYPDRFAKVLLSHDLLRSKKVQCDIIEINESKIANLYNTGCGNYYKLLTYCTSICENLFENSILLNGEGNLTLLHQKNFVNDMLAMRGEFDLFESLKTNPAMYSTGAKECQVTPNMAEMIPNSLLRTKMYYELPCANGNIISQPLVDSGCYELLRELDVQTVPLLDVVDARLARYYLHLNVGMLLDQFIMTEHGEDFDNNKNIMIPTELLDYEQLWIPTDLNHSESGLRFIQEERERVKGLGTINLNSLISIAAMQLLHSMVN